MIVLQILLGLLVVLKLLVCIVAEAAAARHGRGFIDERSLELDYLALIFSIGFLALTLK